MARISERCNVCGLLKSFNNKWCKAHNSSAVSTRTSGKDTAAGIIPKLVCNIFHFDERTKDNKLAHATIVEINGERKGLCQRCHKAYLTLETEA